jgi:hypothetical protein
VTDLTLDSTYQLFQSSDTVERFVISADGREAYWVNDKGELWRKNANGSLQGLVTPADMQGQVNGGCNTWSYGFATGTALIGRVNPRDLFISPDGNYVVYNALSGCSGSAPSFDFMAMKNDGSDKALLGPYNPGASIDGWFPNDGGIIYPTNGEYFPRAVSFDGSSMPPPPISGPGVVFSPNVGEAVWLDYLGSEQQLEAAYNNDNGPFLDNLYPAVMLMDLGSNSSTPKVILTTTSSQGLINMKAISPVTERPLTSAQLSEMSVSPQADFGIWWPSSSQTFFVLTGSNIYSFNQEGKILSQFGAELPDGEGDNSEAFSNNGEYFLVAPSDATNTISADSALAIDTATKSIEAYVLNPSLNALEFVTDEGRVVYLHSDHPTATEGTIYDPSLWEFDPVSGKSVEIADHYYDSSTNFVEDALF